MNTPTLPASIDPVKVKDNPRNSNTRKRNPTRRPRSCSKCAYALYPNTGRCTNCECPRHERKSGGAMTSGELLYEYAPPPLFHGRRWGAWTLDTERLVLVYDARPHPVTSGDGSGVTEGVQQYTAFLGPTKSIWKESVTPPACWIGSFRSTGKLGRQRESPRIYSMPSTRSFTHRRISAAVPAAMVGAVRTSPIPVHSYESESQLSVRQTAR